MTHPRKHLFFLLLLVGGAFITPGCKTGLMGDENLQLAPETYTVVDTIMRSGSNRLSSQVAINWWGTDPDGYVVTYEISFDNISWTKVQVMDSVFTLSLAPGADTGDFRFYVRAVDNSGLTDPSPASLLYPVKNSTPSVTFIFSTGTAQSFSRNPVRTFPVLKYSWDGEDPDGEANLSGFELVWNDTAAIPYLLGKTVSSATFIGVDMTASVTEAEVYPNNDANPAPLRIQGMRLNADNVLYIRSVDLVGAKSAYVAASTVFIKKPVSDILLVNAVDISNPERNNIQAFYASALIGQGKIIFDTLQASQIQNFNYSELSPDATTQSRIFHNNRFGFKKILWFGDVADFSLFLAQKSTADFFNNGGKMLMALDISTPIDERSAAFDFTPVKELVNPGTGVNLWLKLNAQVNPMLAGYPVLVSTTTVTTARPFETANSATDTITPMYTAELTKQPGNIPWTGTSVVMAKRASRTTLKTNFIISSLPLEVLNGNGNINQLFQKLLIDELEF
jgi:hypothetical protein